MSEYHIAVVNSSSFGQWFPTHMERLRKIGPVKHFRFDNHVDGKTLAKALHGYNIIISSVTPFFTKEFFEEKDELLIISRHGIGFNNIDLEAAEEHGTMVTIVPPLVERDAVAENAVTNLLTLIRQTLPAQEKVKDDAWASRASFMGHNLTGKTFGVIGCGNIGSRVAEIFKYGFNGRVLACDPKLNLEWAKKHGIEQVELEQLLAEADIISMNASLNDTSYHILNEEAFDKLAKPVYITNTARGALIDEEALLVAIDQGKVLGLATDVMTEEPAFSSHPYIGHEKILVTPHTSAYTFECLEGMGDKCVTDVETVVAGGQPQNQVKAKDVVK
ncbi:hydroxyacid dehydrogenase [Atopobacter sp. AH10]|uniref:D-isomer specific 2-hydroxyacid dehydrogenase family protein n=1 Tax=Atopobacter sp. AH10 TaxID=2315861 RepID=UPI000EF19F93|nr:D-isomer specific 2-hydroxyacid dehydrogenase family protein [Atopobacter sp. AH10]RLK63492.1 hydroxyacid dehydrogenase [Atopobacter sp. AH10]